MAEATKAVQGDILESDEWRKAVDYAITDEDIERQRKLLGFDQAAKTREYIQTATEDNIRNFAHGCGDDNPLFTDPDYARKTRWGGIIAPGMMTGQINRPMLGDPVPDEIKALRKSLAQYDRVVQSPKYEVIVSREEFQTTYGLLREYIDELSQVAGPQLPLPPPVVR